MRSFFAASLILMATVLLLLSCSRAVREDAAELHALCISLQQSTSPDPGALAGQWEKCRIFFSFWIHQADIRRADEALRLAMLCLDNGQAEEAAKHLDTFARCLDEIADSQRFSLDNIL